MTSSFPLLDLPLLPRLELMKKMKVEHIWRLSDCSRRMHDNVRMTNTRLQFLEVQFFRRQPEYMTVSIHDLAQRPFSLTVTTEPDAGQPTDQEWIGADGLQTLGSSESELSFQKLYVDMAEYADKCGRVVGNVLRLFAVRFIVLRVPAEHIDFLRHIRTVNKLIILGSRPRLTLEHLRMVLEQVDVRSHLNIGAPAVEGVEYRDGFKCRVVEIFEACWVHYDAIINSKSLCIRLYDLPPFSAAQIAGILKLWMSMEKMENLELLALRRPSPVRLPRGFLNDVLRDIPHTPFDDGYMDDEERIDRWNDGKTRDIERADGKKARVRVKRCLFTFKVRINMGRRDGANPPNQ